MMGPPDRGRGRACRSRRGRYGWLTEDDVHGGSGKRGPYPIWRGKAVRALELRQQFVEPIDKTNRVLQLLAQAQDRLVVENIRPVAEPLFVRLVLQLEQDRMMGVDL